MLFRSIKTVKYLVKSGRIPSSFFSKIKQTFGGTDSFIQSKADMMKDLWQSTASLSVDDIMTTQSLIKTGYLPSDFIALNVTQIKNLWKSDAPLGVDDIVTAQFIIKTGHLPDLISGKADLISKSLSSVPSQSPIVTTAASMAKLGLITSVKEMVLWDIDIGSIPADNISALASVVTDRVWINNVTGDVIPVLRSVKKIGRAHV